MTGDKIRPWPIACAVYYGLMWLDAAPLEALTSIDSTNAELARRAAAGERGPSWLSAREQQAGRGRQGREWTSHTGNLYLSLLFAPHCSPGEAALYSFVAANALIAAIEELGAKDARAKWPNDVLVGGRKVAGILLESSGGVPQVDWLIIGMGVNVASAPEGTRLAATSLSAAGMQVTPDALRGVLIRYFAEEARLFRREGFGSVRARWLGKALHLGQPIEARLPQETLCGTFEGIDADGALLLKSAQQTRRIYTADVFFQRDADASGY